MASGEFVFFLKLQYFGALLQLGFAESLSLATKKVTKEIAGTCKFFMTSLSKSPKLREPGLL